MSLSGNGQFQDDPLFSCIVPIYDKEPDVLKRCLLSLADQDYKNLEVVCVLDGPNEGLEHTAAYFVSKYPEKFKLIEIEHKGACAARNEGFFISKGEIVAFINSDYVLKPGIIRLWVDELISHFDCGFVYGAYELATAQRMVYWSKPFDKWELEIANYIDCGFPLWRKYVVSWDENCKSLQDWDFWLRVVKTHGIKGHYLGRDISFIAEPPRSKGLSDDSHNNWIERVRYIKEKNGIPIRDLVVTSIGAPYHGKQIAKLLEADYRDDTLLKSSEYKALYLIGFYMKPTDGRNNGHPTILKHFGDMKVKRIIHFVGADIYWLRKFSWESLQYLRGALKVGCEHILCEDELSQVELAQFGIEAEIVPIPSYDEWEIKPLPEKFVVGIYLVEPGNGEGQSDFDKYLYEHMLSIVRAMPDIQFYAYGKGSENIKYPNLKHHGTLDRKQWKEFVYSCSALLRLTRHDTSAMASNEFIMAGRRVITNRSDSWMDFIDTGGRTDFNEWDKFGSGFNDHHWSDTKTKIISKIHELAYHDFPFDQETASQYYKEKLNKENYRNRIYGLAEIGSKIIETKEVVNV